MAVTRAEVLSDSFKFIKLMIDVIKAETVLHW